MTTVFGEALLAAIARSESGHKPSTLAPLVELSTSRLDRWIQEQPGNKEGVEYPLLIIRMYIGLARLLNLPFADVMDPATRKQYFAMADASICPISGIESDKLRSELAAVRHHLGNAERLVGKGEGD